MNNGVIGMYTNYQQAYTTEEQTIKTQFVADALIRAYAGMEEGTVACLTYHIQTMRKPRNGEAPSISHDYVVTDNGAELESGILSVRATDTRVEFRDSYNGPSILIGWYATTRDLTPVCELLLAVDPRAVIWTLSDVIASITVDDGLDESDLLDWYSDVCSRELYDDITDQEAQDLEDTQE